MSNEGQRVDFKSIRMVTGKTADWSELAKDCVAFANAEGGKIVIGIEKSGSQPPRGQRVPDKLVTLVRRRIGQRTVNVSTTIQSRRYESTDAEFLEVDVLRSQSPASTSDGRYFIRIADESKPLVGEEIQRLFDERTAQPWETLTSLGLPRDRYDQGKLSVFVEGIRASDRVKQSVQEKSDDELLSHYFLGIGPYLTNLGVLCVGRREDRARLGSAPAIQYIKYDDEGRKVNKIAWDDHSYSPMELVETVWSEVPDFRESYELPDGLFRQKVPAYDEKVIRELLVNALVHRPYTQRGDIYLNSFPDRLEIVNPGRLPLGVTPRNILHQSVRRNEQLARVFHDLGLMEREGSGYDLLYEVLTSQGRALPEVSEGPDSVAVTVQRHIVKPEVIDFLEKADVTYSLSQRERIALGILVQYEALRARQLAQILELPDAVSVAGWFTRLQDLGIVGQRGRTRGTRYFVEPSIVHRLEFPAQTTLERIEPHRLRELILEDLKRHPKSAIGKIQDRIGPEIPQHQIRRQLKSLIDKGIVRYEGERRGRRYWLS
jgi:ATP-dependent DNA helicase RecG